MSPRKAPEFNPLNFTKIVLEELVKVHRVDVFDAVRMLTAHLELLRNGAALRSNAWYVANEIVAADLEVKHG